MKIRDFILSLVSWFILLVTVSCSDELGGERAPISSESNLHVLVPTVLSSRGTRTDDASGLPTYNATVDECQINDLTLYAFPVPTGNGNDGKLLVETLPAPLATMMVEPHVANYQFNIEPGTYHIYVVANMNKVLSGKNIQTEDDLKKIVLGYEVGKEPGMPVSTNIPMIYEPKDVNGNIIDTKIEKSGKKYTEVAANLKFTCVKVKLNLIFDPTAEGSAFNGNSYIIKDILAQKLSPSTTLSWDGAFSKPASSVSQDYANGFENKVYATSSEASNKGGYYKAGDWTEDATNANVNNKDIITLVQGATPKAAPQNAADKWLFQGTYYLPERYIAEASQQSTLKVNGSVNGNIENYYKIKLGHRQDESSTSKEVPTFPRGTYYEIIGKIKSLGNMTLDCNVSVKDWKPVEIDADFNHTTLWVSKTEANVTSMKNDYITYNSNAGTVGFGCDTKINSKDIIIGTKRGKDANGNDSIEFRVNPDILISAYSAQSGTAKFWLKANNLKKYIDVHYDVTPYLDVTKELVIYYNKDDKFKDLNTRTIKWDTNLGGIKLDRTTDKKGSSIIKMSVNSSDDATGTFTVTATEDPVTTTIHEFTVTSKDGSMPQIAQIVRVKVSPPIGDYRIYFRAINDRSKYTGSKNTDRFTAIMPEGGDNNWYDGWDNDGGKNTAKEDNHHIYMYTQIGETSEGTSTLTQKRWIYTKGDASKDEWPGEAMKADNTNKGWYYKDFKVNMEPVVKKGTTENRFIKPGETLIMFNNNQDLDLGYTLHRCPHHREPGIPLFDYEDREGWIVYDPTSDPEYHIFDDMPEIEDLNITIYTEKKTMGWYREYGIAGNSKTDQFKIHDENSDANVDHGNSWKREKKGNWWKTVITLKAIKGEHNKDIKIKQQDGDELTLFNGNSFKDDTGYYKNGKWYQGTPDDVTE